MSHMNICFSCSLVSSFLWFSLFYVFRNVCAADERGIGSGGCSGIEGHQRTDAGVLRQFSDVVHRSCSEGSDVVVGVGWQQQLVLHFSFDSTFASGILFSQTCRARAAVAHSVSAR